MNNMHIGNVRNAAKKLLALVCVFSCIFSLCGCGSSLDGTEADLMRNVKAKEVSGKALPEGFTDHVSDFCIRLFQQSYLDDKNTMVCPLSVYMSLSMILNGAAGNTKTELEKVMGESLKSGEMNEALSSYWRALPSSKSAKYSMANSIWFNKRSGDFKVNQDFLQKNADYFNASIYNVEFNDRACDNMNAWVKKKTDGYIDQIVSKEDMKSALAILLNTALFDAEWENVYQSDDMFPDSFHAKKGSVEVTYMCDKEHQYISEGDVKGFIKPYKGGNYSFVALLPPESQNIDSFVADLSGDELTKLIEGAKNEDVNTSLPKFDFECDLPMIPSLKNMGVNDLFEPSVCDLSAMGSVSNKNIYINDVEHRTYIKLDGKGTKAAAVTKSELNCTSAMIQEEHVTLDRPFVFAIIDNATSIPLFIGSVLDPTLKN